MGIESFLPLDWQRATLLGHVDIGAGPTPILLRNAPPWSFDLSELMRNLAERGLLGADARSAHASF